MIFHDYANIILIGFCLLEHLQMVSMNYQLKIYKCWQLKTRSIVWLI